MTRLGGAFWFVVVIAAGVTNFVVKQTVQSLDDQLANVRKQTVVAQKEIHALSADWTFLNQPELLADLNRRHIGLAPVTPKQLVGNIDNLPLRPPAPLPPEPATPVAAAPPETATPPAASAEPAIVALTPLEPPPASIPAPLTANAAVIPLEATATVPPPATAAHAQPATPPMVMKVAAAAPARPAAPPAPSLDAVFAQIAGDR